MCGIAGAIGPTATPKPRLTRALRALHHRGPDNEARLRLHHGPAVVDLLHTRLSIIDLDPRANQPMTIDGCAMVFNGEIYNYTELRSQLEARGHCLRTQSDTEVLLRCWIEYGYDAFERLDGMWALAIYDTRRHRLVLSRDRLGEKPLYLWPTDGRLYFASETPALTALVGRRPPVNHRHIARFLVNGYKALHKTDELFYEQIRPLAPGTTLTVRGDLNTRTRRYWSLNIHSRPMSLEQTTDALREQLIESVYRRLRADVPVACCLSGGVDSGALASIAVKVLETPVAAFSIIDRDERYDESANIDHTLRDLGCEHTAVRLPPPDPLGHLRRLVADHDAPVYTLSYYLHALLSEAVAERGYKVVLSGTGADELLTGYYDHFNLHLAVVHGTVHYAPALRAWRAHVQPLVRNPHLRRGDLYLNDPGFREHIYLNHDVFAGLLLDGFDEPFAERHYCDELLRNRMANELLHEVVPPILHEDDLNSMRCSIENRSPYLDPALIELAYAIPPEHLIRDGYGKYALRQALAGILNDAVRLDRRKVGFNAAFHSVFDPDDPQIRAYLLDDGPIFELIDRARIETLLEMDPLPNSYSKFLFALVATRAFLEHAADGSCADAYGHQHALSV